MKKKEIKKLKKIADLVFADENYQALIKIENLIENK